MRKKELIMGLFILFAFIGCSDGEEIDDSTKELTPEEMEIVCEKTWNEVSNLIGDKYLEAESPSDLSGCANEIQRLDYVDKAFTDDNGMHVILKNGSLWSWTFFHLIPEPSDELLKIDKFNTPINNVAVKSESSFDSHVSKRKENEKVKVLIFNQTFKDESRRFTKGLYDNLKKYLEDNGFEVVLKEGNYVMDDLDKYDLALLHTHGLYLNNNHYLFTSREREKGGPFDLSVLTETRNGKKCDIAYESISERWVKQKYVLGRKLEERETLIFTTACEALKDNANLAVAFNQAGASGFIGYTDSNSVGLFAANSFFMSLANDANIEEAINIIPHKYKNEYSYVDPETDKKTDLDAHLNVHYRSNKNKNNCYAHLCPEGEHPHLIDMGNGLKWSCCNIGAESPGVIGNYYSWGETETKSSYSYSDNYEMQNNVCFPSNISGRPNDVAWVKTNHALRMPTKAEFQTLLSNSTLTWGKCQGTDGAYFISKINGNKIFVPAGGWIFNGQNLGRGDTGILWTANRDPDSPFSWFMQVLYNNGNSGAEIARSRYSGHNVRGVAVPKDSPKD